MQYIRKVTSDEVIISFANQEGKKRGVDRIENISHAKEFLKCWGKDFFFSQSFEKCEWQLVEFNKEDFFKFKAPLALTWCMLLGNNFLIENASRDRLDKKKHKNLIELDQDFNWFHEFKPIVVEKGNYYILLDGTSRSFVYRSKIKEGREGGIFEGFKGYLGRHCPHI
ncbi:hypothetical protein C4E24_07115 [ANME-1 cluster archaeon AG-394-G21]|nr:hypothetical protein [ANME-1 cluster archaeon AG-394-G21]